jgi:hypothetical protein
MQILIDRYVDEATSPSLGDPIKGANCPNLAATGRDCDLRLHLNGKQVLAHAEAIKRGLFLVASSEPMRVIQVERRDQKQH